jgi:hypothetical protein
MRRRRASALLSVASLCYCCAEHVSDLSLFEAVYDDDDDRASLTPSDKRDQFVEAGRTEDAVQAEPRQEGLTVQDDPAVATIAPHTIATQAPHMEVAGACSEMLDDRVYRV